jgi:hypothetical protein
MTIQFYISQARFHIQENIKNNYLENVQNFM